MEKTTLGKRMIYSFVLLFCFSNIFSQELITGWDFNGLSAYGSSPLNGSSVNANVDASGLTRGSGITTSGLAASNAWGGNGEDQTSLANAVANNDFAYFTVSPKSGYKLSLSSIAPYNIRRSPTGSTSGQWQYQINSGAFVDIGSPITWGATTTLSGNLQATINLSGISSLQNIESGTVITFRIVFWGASAATGTCYLNNFQTGNDLIVNGVLETTSSVTPTITVTEVAVPTMKTDINTNVLEAINVSGTNLTEDIALNVTGTNASLFELSIYSVPQTDGTAVSTEVYIKYKPTEPGTHTATLTLSSAGATNVTRTLTGIAIDPANPYGLDDSTPVSELNETFESPTVVGTTMPTNWTKASVAGTNSWEIKAYNSNQYAQMSAFGTTGVQQSLLISPAIDFNQIVKNNVTFGWIAGYAKVGTTLKVYVMTLDGTKTLVKTIDADVPASGYAADFTTETLDLSAYSGVKFLVFEYNGDGSNSLTTTYQLDNIVVQKDLGTGLIDANAKLNVSVENSNIKFTAVAGESVEVFTAVGQRLISQTTVDGLNSIPVAARGVVLVKIGTRISKVIM